MGSTATCLIDFLDGIYNDINHKGASGSSSWAYAKPSTMLVDYADVVYDCLAQIDTHLLQKLQNSAL